MTDILWSDQGPQFTSKMFQDFSKEWGFQHITLSPQYPQSNGKIEATVKSMKNLHEKEDYNSRGRARELTRGDKHSISIGVFRTKTSKIAAKERDQLET